MRRSRKKGPFISSYIQKKIIGINKNYIKQSIRTWSRKSIITPIIIGHTIFVYNGYYYISVFVKDQIIRHKLGEFFWTQLTIYNRIKYD